MPLKIRHAILPALGFAAGLAALGAAQSETVVRLAAPEAVKVTRLPGTVEGLAGDIAAIAAPAPAVNPAPAPAATSAASSAAPMRSLRPDPRPESVAGSVAASRAGNVVVIRKAEPSVALARLDRHAPRGGCDVLAAMPDRLAAASFPEGFAGILTGLPCAR